jgi:hypothetical protein
MGMSLTIKITIVAVALAVVAFAVWRIMRIATKDDPAPIERTQGPFDVVSIESGASLTYAAGRHDRRHEVLALPGIAAPGTDAKGGQFSYAGLATVIGFAEVGKDGDEILIDQNKFGKITIHEAKSKRLDRYEADDVFNSSGQCLQISQLSNGLAWCQADAPKAYQDAQRAAQKKKCGLWSIADYDAYRLKAAEESP